MKFHPTRKRCMHACIDKPMCRWYINKVAWSLELTHSLLAAREIFLDLHSATPAPATHSKLSRRCLQRSSRRWRHTQAILQHAPIRAGRAWECANFRLAMPQCNVITQYTPNVDSGYTTKTTDKTKHTQFHRTIRKRILPNLPAELLLN